MKRCLAAFAIAASQFAPVAHADDALETKVRAYVPVFSLAKVCDLRINDAASDDHRAILAHAGNDSTATIPRAATFTACTFMREIGTMKFVETNPISDPDIAAPQAG